MIFKILMLLLVVAGLIYWIKQPRGVQTAAPRPPARRRSADFIALCVGAAISAIAAALSAVLWMGSVASGVTGGGYRGEADALLPVAGFLLALAVACAIGAFLRR